LNLEATLLSGRCVCSVCLGSSGLAVCACAARSPVGGG